MEYGFIEIEIVVFFYFNYIRIEFDYLRIGIKYNSCLVVIIINFFLYNKCICVWCM